MKIIVNEEKIAGNPHELDSHIRKEICKQIQKMTNNNYEDVCENMRQFSRILQAIQENINKGYIEFVYNPMGDWFLKERD